MAGTVPITVIETPEFLSATRKLINDEKRALLVPDVPIFVLTAYAKNERADLSQQDRNDFRKLTALLVRTFKRTKP